LIPGEDTGGNEVNNFGGKIQIRGEEQHFQSGNGDGSSGKRRKKRNAKTKSGRGSGRPEIGNPDKSPIGRWDWGLLDLGLLSKKMKCGFKVSYFLPEQGWKQGTSRFALNTVVPPIPHHHMHTHSLTLFSLH